MLQLTDQQFSSHATMRDRFNELADVVSTPKAPKGAAKEMHTILTTYAEQFKCSTASAYSRIKYNLVNLANQR